MLQPSWHLMCQNHPIPEKPNWHDTIKAFGLDARAIQDVAEDVKKPDDAT